MKRHVLSLPGRQNKRPPPGLVPGVAHASRATTVTVMVTAMATAPPCPQPVRVREKGHRGHAADTAFAGVDTLLELWWQAAVSGAHLLGGAEGAQVPEAAHSPQRGNLAPVLQCTSALRLSIPGRR